MTKLPMTKKCRIPNDEMRSSQGSCLQISFLTTQMRRDLTWNGDVKFASGVDDRVKNEF